MWVLSIEPVSSGRAGSARLQGSLQPQILQKPRWGTGDGLVGKVIAIQAGEPQF